MKKRKILLSSLFVFHSIFIFSQSRKCAVAFEAHNTATKYHQLQRAIDRVQITNSRSARISDEVINIPVVVHVIHNNPSGIIGGPGNSNISDEQIFSQIQVLNNDFRRKVNTLGFNANPDGADMELNFVLARFTPEGLPSSGIVRVFSEKRAFDVFTDNELLSSLSYWDSNRYMNVWVTNLQDNFIGYAEFPTGDFNGLDFEETNASTDGIIIDHTVFGNQTGTAINGQYAYGRTLTHEIGHWFGLIHTWGDAFCGTDYCEDTPKVDGPNNTTSCVALPSVCDGVRRIPMIENYMDYTPDTCMNTFTIDQKERVRAILEISQRRNRLIKAALLNFEPVTSPVITVLNNPGNNSEVKLKIQMPDFQNFKVEIFDISGKLVFEKEYIDFPGLLAPMSDFTKHSGMFIVRLTSGLFESTKKIIVL